MRIATAAGVLVGLVFLVTLATPYVSLPVGTATAVGTSMGAETMHVLVYVDPVLAGVDVGDAVVYRADGEYVHHRIVGETEQGYLTKGDAVPWTDQARGAPYVTERDLVGVVVIDLAIATVWRIGAVLLGILAGLGIRQLFASPTAGS